jgi:hypothetical protein
MPEQHFLSASASPATHTDLFGPLQGGERGLWQGRCAVAEYAFDEVASLPRWVLPETTEVLVTDHRVMYAYARSDSPDDLEVTSGELRWLWPQHLRVQPGALTTGRAAAAAQVQLVCAASDGSFPALVFAGGELGTVADADRLANLIRHAIARFRVDNADKLGLSTSQERMLSRLLIGPEFSNYQGGTGQTVSLLGALPVHRPALAEPEIESVHVGYPESAGPAAGSLPPVDAPAPAPLPADPYPASVSGTTLRLPGHRPGLAADEARALQAAAAEEATNLTQPDLASRAADLAARVASLVAATSDEADEELAAADQAAADRALEDGPTTDLTAKSANVRRAAARFAANSAKGKAAVRRSEPEIGSTSRGNRPR